MIPTDPVFLALLALILGFFFFLFLLLRRTVLGFREGVDRGRN